MSVCLLFIRPSLGQASHLRMPFWLHEKNLNMSLKDPPANFTQVNVAFSVYQLKVINDLEQYVSMEIAVIVTWTDAR